MVRRLTNNQPKRSPMSISSSSSFGGGGGGASFFLSSFLGLSAAFSATGAEVAAGAAGPEAAPPKLKKELMSLP